MVSLSLTLLGLAASAQAFTAKALLSTTTIPNTVSNGPAFMNTTSGFYGLDGPQISAVNNASYEWWYFDAVSPDLNASVVIVFYTTNSSAFFFIPDSNSTTVAHAYITYANGTRAVVQVPASDAVITTRKQGASGNWVGTGAAFTGAADLSSYFVEFNSPQNGIVGTFFLDSVAPPTYACSPAVGPNQNTLVAPNLGWAAAIPDADGTVNLTVYGTPVQFQGPAYHDKNWGNVPFQQNIQTMIWGHGRLETYSIVWWTIIDALGAEHVSAYVSVDEEILVSSCRPGSIVVRPWGNHSEYPPTAATGNPDGFLLTIQVPCGVLAVNVTTNLIIGEAGPVYARYTGSMTGSLNGGKNMTGGLALYEEFRLQGFHS